MTDPSMTVTTPTDESAFDPANPGGATPPAPNATGFDADPAAHEAFNDPEPGASAGAASDLPDAAHDGAKANLCDPNERCGSHPSRAHR